MTVTPAALYSVGCLILRDQDINRLRVTQRRMLRKIVRPMGPPPHGGTREHWQVWRQEHTHRAEALLTEAGGQLWCEAVRRKQWDWAGHVFRMDDTRWPKQVLNLKPIQFQTHVHHVQGERLSQVVAVLPGDVEGVRQQGHRIQWIHQRVRFAKAKHGEPLNTSRFQGQRRLDYDYKWSSILFDWAQNRAKWKKLRDEFVKHV